MNNDSSLSLEAQQKIRDYLIKIFAIPGILITFLSFAAGFFIKDVALAKAEFDANQKVTDGVAKALDRINVVTEEAIRAAAQAELAKSAATDTMRQSEELHDKIRRADVYTSVEKILML